MFRNGNTTQTYHQKFLRKVAKAKALPRFQGILAVTLRKHFHKDLQDIDFHAKLRKLSYSKLTDI